MVLRFDNRQIPSGKTCRVADTGSVVQARRIERQQREGGPPLEAPLSPGGSRRAIFSEVAGRVRPQVCIYPFPSRYDHVTVMHVLGCLVGGFGREMLLRLQPFCCF